METWLLLIILGVTTYFIVSRGVSKITTTPVWMLWLVLMTPAISLTLWAVVYGEQRPMPALLLLGLFIFSPLGYWFLVQAGRRHLPKENSEISPIDESNPHNSSISPPETPLPLRPITKEEEVKLRECFPWGIYYLQNVEYFPQAMVCRGKLRTDPDRAYKTINQNIKTLFSDRFYVIFQETAKGSPVFTLVPNPQVQNPIEQEPIFRPFLALGLILVTLLTTTAIGADLVGLSTKQVQSNPALLVQGLPYALALMAILSIHELGHYFTSVYYRMQTTLPYFIPVPFFLGTLGAFIQMRSPVPHRKALFDVGIAGPVAGLLMALPLLIWGLVHSRVVPFSDASNLLNFESLNPRFSLLLTLISKLALGSQFTAGTVINLHPVAIAGYIGLVITAFNLMPLGQLDGGHMVHAMFGQKKAVAIGQITRILVLLLALLQPDLIIWAIVLFFMPITDQPALNDVSELDNWRDVTGLVALGFLVMMIVPVPGVITRLLNI